MSCTTEHRNWHRRSQPFRHLLRHFNTVLNSAVLSSKDAFRCICASVFQIACFHETLKSDINFIFRSYAHVTNEDKKYTSTHTTLLVNYKESPIETLSFLLWFCLCLRSVKEICLAISRNLSKRFVAFQQYRLVSLENTKFENESVNHKTTMVCSEIQYTDFIMAFITFKMSHECTAHT